MDTDNRKPFASVPLSNENGLMQSPAVVEVQANTVASHRIDDEYPEIYRELYPLIVDAAERLMAAGYEPATDMINAMVDAIIKNSGMWYEDDDEAAAEAATLSLGFGGAPYRKRLRRHHNRNSLRDIIRILLLRELSDRRGRRPYPGYMY